MKELVLEQKFSAIKLAPSLKYFKIFLILVLLYFVVYALTDFFIEDQPVFKGYVFQLLN